MRVGILAIGCVLAATLVAAACSGDGAPPDAAPAGSPVSTPQTQDSDDPVASTARAQRDAATETPDAPAPDAPADTMPAWEPLPPLPAGPRQETAVVAVGADVYVLGGFDARGRIVDIVEVLDTTTQTWRDGPSLPLPLHHANAAVVDGRVYVLGFLVGNFQPDGRAFVLDPGAGAWRSLTPMPTGAERGASAVAVRDGRIIVAGGLRGGSISTVSVYDPAADTWSAAPDLPAPLDHAAGGAIDGVVFVAAGRNGPVLSARLFALAPGADAWTTGPSMPTPRGGVAAGVVDGSSGGALVVVGGEGNPDDPLGVFDDVAAYDPARDAWERLDPMLVPRHGMGAASVGAWLYVPGGATRAGFGAVDTTSRLGPF